MEKDSLEKNLCAPSTMEVELPTHTLKNSKTKSTLSNDLVGKKIAVVHEWLSTNAGSESVTKHIVKLVDKADIFATVEFMSNADRKSIAGDRKIHTSFIQWLPFARRHFRYYLPIFPIAVRSHNLKKYDVIISSSHAFAHGIRKRKSQIQICYCHTPMRYIWDMKDIYLESHGINSGVIGWASKLLTDILRLWDARVSKNVDFYIANSTFTAQRIRRFYGRKAEVIFPPVNVNKYQVEEDKEDFYITVSRLVCYKKVDLVVDAFTKMPDKKLIVIGDGNEKDKIQSSAGENITFLSHLEFEKFHYYMRKAKAFVFAGKEDFGITLVEAQACGTPLIAFHKGGAAEIVKHGKTGVLFKKQNIEAITNAVEVFEKDFNGSFSAKEIRENANRFSTDSFNEHFSNYVKQCVAEKHGDQI